jgi:hypothetical protein
VEGARSGKQAERIRRIRTANRCAETLFRFLLHQDFFQVAIDKRSQRGVGQSLNGRIGIPTLSRQGVQLLPGALGRVPIPAA